MSDEVRVPIRLNVKQPVDFSIRELEVIEVTAGKTTILEMEYNKGQPPVTDAQLRQMELEIYTDAEKTNRLSENDESNYTLTVDPLDDPNPNDDTIGKCRISFNLSNIIVTEETDLHVDVLVRQG